MLHLAVYCSIIDKKAGYKKEDYLLYGIKKEGIILSVCLQLT